FTLLVPTVVELPLVLVAPFAGDLMRGMDTRGAEINKPWLRRIGGPGIARPGDRLVGHVGSELVALLRRLRLRGRRRAAIQGRKVLIRFPLVEAVEVVEALARRPVVKRSRRADL